MMMGKKLMRLDANLVAFWCPGCDMLHPLAIEKPNHLGAKWSFDGNLELPTFHPSVVLKGPFGQCHSFIIEGRIRFLNDCEHKLSGQIVELPDIPAEEID